MTEIGNLAASTCRTMRVDRKQCLIEAKRSLNRHLNTATVWISLAFEGVHAQMQMVTLGKYATIACHTHSLISFECAE